MRVTLDIRLITLVVTLGGLLFGYDTAVISGATEALQSYFGLSATELGFAAASALLGCMLGAYLAGYLSSYYGRRGASRIAALLFILGSIGTAVPKTYEVFVLFRIIGGVGVGIASMVSPLYIAEIAPAGRRGALVSFNQLAIVMGMLLVYLVNYGIAMAGTEAWLNQVGWRYMFASEMVPALLFFMLLFFVPETPRWLAMQGREKEVRTLLVALNAGTPCKAEWQEIMNSLQQPTAVRLFQHGIIGIVVIGMMLSILQQVTGINVVLYYAPRILKNIGNSGIDLALLQTVLVGVINAIFTLIAIFMVDRWGRRPLLMLGAGVMAISMIAIGTAAWLENVGSYLLPFMLAYIGAFALSLGPVTWVLLAEMFPNKIRAKALSVAVLIQWLANFSVSQTFPMMNAEGSWLHSYFHGGFPFWLYGAFGLFTVYFVYRWVPETRGLSLEALEQLWHHKYRHVDTSTSQSEPAGSSCHR